MDAPPVILSAPVTAFAVGAGLAAGWLAGRAHFASLAAIVRSLLAGNVGQAVALQLGRLALLALALAAVARLGGLALLCALAGILAARRQVLRAQEPPP